ncbi:MAG: hypothetical protein ACKOSS_07575 [Planctomycetia bacterium]
MNLPRPRRVLVLLHESDRKAEQRAYQLWLLAERWRADGVDVVLQHGVGRFVEADVAIHHVDLTVTPSEYVAHLLRYPLAINGRLLDISKRRISKNLLGKASDWAGPVIVKTDLNCGGEMEWRLQATRWQRRLQRLRMATTLRPWRYRRRMSAEQYLVLPSLAEVTPDMWLNRDLVVERFLPERDGTRYVLRTHTFFGPRTISRRSLGPVPVLKAGLVEHVEEVPDHPDVLAFARALHMERGKVDYVEHEGRAVVLDVARTNTIGAGMSPERRAALAERLAPGLYDLWAAHLARSAAAPAG